MRTVTDTAYSDWGGATETTSDEGSLKAMVSEITPEEKKEMEGIYPEAEKIFFFKADQSNITEGNRIIHDSETYEIVRVRKRQSGGITLVLEVWAKKG